MHQTDMLCDSSDDCNTTRRTNKKLNIERRLQLSGSVCMPWHHVHDTRSVVIPFAVRDLSFPLADSYALSAP